MEIGLIGCGNMGGAMALQLLASHQRLTCFDPDAASHEAMRHAQAQIAATPAALARGAQIILLSLPKASVVEAVMRDILSQIQPGTIVLDTSTSEPRTSQAMAALATEHGFFFVDGPVSGGPAAARSGTMTMLLGGAPEAIDRLRPVLDILTAKTVVVGGSGAGHAAKIANNMLCAANLVLVAEAVRLGQAAGVAPEDLLEGINAGSGRSGVSEVNFPKWILTEAFDSGFSMGLMRKDVGLALDLAASSGVDVSGFSNIAQIWLQDSQNLSDTQDFNAIATYTERGQNNV